MDSPRQMSLIKEWKIVLHLHERRFPKIHKGLRKGSINLKEKVKNMYKGTVTGRMSIKYSFVFYEF